MSIVADSQQFQKSLLEQLKEKAFVSDTITKPKEKVQIEKWAALNFPATAFMLKALEYWHSRSGLEAPKDGPFETTLIVPHDLLHDDLRENLVTHGVKITPGLVHTSRMRPDLRAVITRGKLWFSVRKGKGGRKFITEFVTPINFDLALRRLLQDILRQAPSDQFLTSVHADALQSPADRYFWERIKVRFGEDRKF